MWDKRQSHRNSSHSHRGTDTATIPIDRTKKGIQQSSNFISGSSGAEIDWISGSVEFNDGYFKGDISAATGTFKSAISIGTSPNWFRVDSDGDHWSGAALIGDATFSVTKEGLLTCSGATVSGAITITSGSGIASLSDAGALAVEDDLDGVPDGTTYAKVLNTDITAGHILLSETTGDLDNIDDGTTYSRIATTDITAGHITVVSQSASININDTTFGNKGVQFQYNSGTPRGYIGDGANAFFNFDGTKLTWKATNSELDASGNLTVSSATISGAITTQSGSALDGQYIGVLSIVAGSIANSTITATQIQTATITATEIANATITATQIQSATITAAQIANLTITATQIQSATITTAEIANNTITAGNIVNATITATEIANNTITAGQIQSATVTTAEIANNTIVAGNIASSTITTSEISNTAGIVGGQIASLTIVAGNISNLTITAAQIANTTITGGKIVPDTLTGSLLKVGNQSWSHDLAFSSTNSAIVAWGSGTITAASQTTFSIDAGNTQTMSARTYVYLDTGTSNTVLQITQTVASAVGDGKILIAVAENSTTEATFQVFGGIGGIAITGGDIENTSITSSQIAANTITANEIYANTITASEIASATITTTEIAATTIVAGNIAAATITGNEIAATTIAAGNIVANTITSSQLTTGAFVTQSANISNAIITDAKIVDLAVSKLTAGTITSKAITLAVSAGTGDVKIQAGRTDFGQTAQGFILGIDDSDSDLAKFEIGDEYNSLDWTGDYVKLKGLLQFGTYHIMGHRNDGFEEITSGGATVTRDLMITRLRTTTQTSSVAELKSQAMTTTLFSHANTFGANIKFNISLSENTWGDAGVYGFAGLIEQSASIDTTGVVDTDRHIGFYIQGVAGPAVSKVFATNADGTTQTTTEIGVISSPASVFRFEKRGTGTVRFYRNNVLVATHTSNIPVFAITYKINVAIGNNATGVDAFLECGNNYQVVADY